MKEAAIKFPVPESGIPALARNVLERWNTAVQFRSTEKVGSGTLTSVLSDCYNQRNGILSAEDQQMIQELGPDYYINLSELKTSTLNSIFTDMLINTDELPFLVRPTPLPELSKDMELEILDRVKQRVLGNNPNPQQPLMPLIRQMKEGVIQESIKRSEMCADKMQRLIKDQCIEGGFYPSMMKFLDDFVTYPFAVMHGPVPIMKPVQKWSGNKIVTAYEIGYQFTPTSVFDFFYAPDCESAQTGAGVFVRQRVSKRELYQCAKMDSYIKENVLKVLEKTLTGSIQMSWSSENPEQPRVWGNMWGNGDTLEVLRHYGVFSGRELQEFNITGLDADDFYEASISIIQDIIIQVHVNPNPHNPIRPVYTASYENSGMRIPGVSICQKVRDVERAYVSALRMLMTNAGYAAGPIGEVDMERVAKYLDKEDIGKLAPNMVYPVEPNKRGGGTPAYYFHDVPNHAGLYLNLMQTFMGLADQVTQLPAALHGQPVGTGANRTFRGMAMLYGNAMKPIQKAMTNMDMNLFSPLGNLMYNMNMTYHNDPEVKGDAKVYAQGTNGILQKELAKQTAFDTLNLVATAGSAAQGMVNPNAVKWAIDTALAASGVPKDILDEIPAMPPQPEIPQEGPVQ